MSFVGKTLGSAVGKVMGGAGGSAVHAVENTALHTVSSPMLRPASSTALHNVESSVAHNMGGHPANMGVSAWQNALGPAHGSPGAPGGAPVHPAASAQWGTAPASSPAGHGPYQSMPTNAAPHFESPATPAREPASASPSHASGGTVGPHPAGTLQEGVHGAVSGIGGSYAGEPQPQANDAAADAGQSGSKGLFGGVSKGDLALHLGVPAAMTAVSTIPMIWQTLESKDQMKEQMEYQKEQYDQAKQDQADALQAQEDMANQQQEASIIAQYGPDMGKQIIQEMKEMGYLGGTKADDKLATDHGATDAQVAGTGGHGDLGAAQPQSVESASYAQPSGAHSQPADSGEAAPSAPQAADPFEILSQMTGSTEPPAQDFAHM